MLSGGEQRRALVSGSELIPAGNLDSGNGGNIIGILKELAHTSERCVVVVTHDHSVASRADERCACATEDWNCRHKKKAR